MSEDAPHDPQEAKDEAKGSAAAAGTGLGCLAFATLPWSIIILIILVVLILGIVHKFLR